MICPKTGRWCESSGCGPYNCTAAPTLPEPVRYGWICPKCGGSNGPNQPHCVLCTNNIPEPT